MFEQCDINGDGRINFDDINPFVALLSSGAGGSCFATWLGPGTTCDECCHVPRPPAGTFTWEGEHRGLNAPPDHYNGGCNSDPPVYQPLACGQTIRGWAGAYAGAPDTDWYTCTTAMPSTVRATLASEFRAEFWILRAGRGPNACDPNDPNGYVVLQHALVPKCTAVELVSGLEPAGEFWIVVALRETAGNYAFAGYNLTVTCGE